ncbi:MAG: hypothetical protein KAR79_02150 [Simkaniaceae bacterium]|nr:hypothetical protein [Simkaniaceae bacterium]
MHHTPRKMLAKTLAAFLILQYFTVEKTPPDLIIPMPEPWINKLGKKESVNTLIAKEMSRIQNIDMLKAFKCPHYFSKHQLRMYLKLNSSFTKHGKKLVDKRVILIADVIHSKEPFTKASQLLSGFFPSSIIGMGLVHLPNAKGA